MTTYHRNAAAEKELGKPTSAEKNRSELMVSRLNIHQLGGGESRGEKTSAGEGAARKIRGEIRGMSGVCAARRERFFNAKG